MLNNYPSLSEEEFGQACRTLESKCHDQLDMTNWMSVRWHDGELHIKQTGEHQNIRRSDGTVEHGNEDGSEECDENSTSASDDEAIVTCHVGAATQQTRLAVDFSILLSPTYRVPVLWFMISPLKPARIQDLEEVYARIVSPGFHQALEGIGIMGGISLSVRDGEDNTIVMIEEIPAFFVHPCNTAGAMVALNDGSTLDPFRYLLLWFGVVAAGVGLHVPSRVVSL